MSRENGGIDAGMIAVEGVDYSTDGIESVRQDLIRYRDASIDQWPDAIPVTLTLSHAIALLARMRELVAKPKKPNSRKAGQPP